MTETVLITGARAPVAQDLARACRAAGYRTHLADSAPSHAARALRPRFPVHRLPPPRHDFGAFRRAMRDLIETIGADRIIPTCEEVFWLAEAARRDGYADRLFAPDIEQLRRLHSKAEFPAFAASVGIAAPQTWVLNDPAEATGLSQPLSELVLKPEYSRFGTFVMVGPSRRQVARQRSAPGCRWVAQQRIRGEEYCSWAALRDGKVTAFAAYRPRRRHGRGAAFMIEAVASPAIRRISEQIGAATGMTGHLGFDIIVDAAGVPYPIECNPRAVSGLHLLDAQADLARAVVAGAPCAEPVAGMLRHMGPAMALLALPTALREGRPGPLAADWRASRDVINREGHAAVTLGCLADAAGFAFQALRSARSPAGAATADIEWDGGPMP
jgi:hypothetical protein